MIARVTLISSIAVHMQRCKSKNCRRLIEAKEEYYIDTLSSGSYCERCGTCLKYHRKKALERGEKLPVTFENVDERMAQK